MTDDNLSELNIDTIMARIKKETERIKAVPASPNETEFIQNRQVHKIYIFPHNKETFIWRLVKKIQHMLQQYSFYSILYRLAVRFKTFIPKYKK
jgi:hypothetical protein